MTGWRQTLTLSITTAVLYCALNVSPLAAWLAFMAAAIATTTTFATWWLNYR